MNSLHCLHSHPLALTEGQLSIIRDHAQFIRPAYRAAFMSDITDRLLPIDPTEVDDDVVLSATTCAFRRFMGVP